MMTERELKNKAYWLVRAWNYGQSHLQGSAKTEANAEIIERLIEETAPEPTKSADWCYFIEEGQDPKEHSGFVPSVVTRDEAGHSPLTGRGRHASPWIWGSTFEEAVKICRKANLDNLDLDDSAVASIVLSSMRATRRTNA